MARKHRSKTSKKPTQPAAKDLAGRRRWLYTALAVALLATLHFVLAVTSVIHKSNTYDELAHLTRGYSYALTGDYRLGPPHPPLAHYWASLPGRGLAVKPPKRDQKAWYKSDVWEIGRQFFYYKNLGNDAVIDSLLWRGRAMIALWSTALGLFVFFWSRRLFGPAGGFISLTLYALSPTMLANARLVTTDCAVALFFMAGVTCVWWVLQRLTPGSVLCGAVALTGLFLSKMSAVLVIPVGLILLLLRMMDGRALPVRLGRWRREITTRWGRLTCWLGVMVFWIVCTWAGLWAAYGFRYEAMVDAQAGRDRFYSLGAVPEGKTVWEYQLRKLDHYKPVIGWLREHRVFPEAYIYSAAFSAQTARGRNSFLNGHISIHGHRWFFPYTFLAKTPLPLFGLLAVSGSAAFFARRQSDSPAPKKSPPAPNEPHPAMSFLYRTSPLWVFFGVYWAASLQSHLNIGHRHVMPTYPVLFVLCGASACYLRARSNALRLVVPVLVLLFAACSVYIYPHYLTYFNSIAGGPDKGYRHLVDSSLDWGQDLPGLRKYLDARRAEGFAGDVYVSYFGSGSTLALSHFGVEARTLRLKLSDDATGQYAYTPGLYAISATNLHQIYSTVGRNTPLHTWTDKLDDLYDEHRAAVQPFLASPDTKGARAPFANKRFQKVFNRFERLRLARLCAYLRHREPDHVVNHTILVFDLDQDELHKALIEPISESGLIPFVNPAAPG